MFSATEDDEFFNPTSSSNLASLFGTSMNLNQGGNSKLTYTAPKQPRTGNQETLNASPKPVTPHSSVICSKFVNVFKLEDKSHISQGKCGLAIIGSHSLKAYELIIYRSKQDIIMRVKFKSDFAFTVQQNNFGCFVDDQNQQWSVHFENIKDIDEFTQEINTHGGKIVWANKTVDSKSTNKTNAEKAKSQLTEPPRSEPLPRTPQDKESDSPSDSSSTQTKANILSRMAKMGQPILPITPPPKKSSEHSDSDTDEPELHKKPIKKRQRDQTLSDNKSKVPQTINTTISTIPEYMMLNGQILPVNSVQQNLPVLFTSNSPISDPFNIFIAENRTHNCELRMNINQLSSKLDNVLTQLNLSQQATASSDNSTALNELQLKLAEKVRELEDSKTLIQNLQEQHEKSLQSTADNTATVDQIKQQNEMQATIILEQKQKIQELEQRNVSLEEQVVNSELLINNLEEQKLKIEALNETIEEQNMRLETLQQDSETNENSQEMIDKLNDTIASLQQEMFDMNSKADVFAKNLKQSMNQLYQQIMENFEDENVEFQTIQIKNILSQKLKVGTFTIIQEFLKDFKKPEQSS